MSYRSLRESFERVKKIGSKRSLTGFFQTEQHDEIFIAGLSIIENHN